jgi:hypothetical protein
LFDEKPTKYIKRASFVNVEENHVLIDEKS